MLKPQLKNKCIDMVQEFGTKYMITETQILIHCYVLKRDSEGLNPQSLMVKCVHREIIIIDI